MSAHVSASNWSSETKGNSLKRDIIFKPQITRRQAFDELLNGLQNDMDDSKYLCRWHLKLRMDTCTNRETRLNRACYSLQSCR